MKKIIVIVVVVALVVSGIYFISSGNNASKESATEKIKVKNVETVEVVSEATPIEIEYTGIVKPDELTNYSFRNAGQVAKINVKVGDKISVGDIIATLNREDIKVQLEVVKQTYQTAVLDEQKAYDLYRFNQNNYEKLNNLYDTGAISKDKLDTAMINLSTYKLVYQQAGMVAESARLDLEYKADLLEDTVIVAQSAGTVVAVNSKEGDRVNVGMPICSVRNEVKVITIGVAQKDLKNMAEGTIVNIDLSESVIDGKIISIGEIPDNYTRTYEVKISLEDDSVSIGSIVNVRIKTAMEDGIWIPIQSIVSSSIDYVYIVEDGKAIKKTVSIESFNDAKAKVIGLEAGDEVVTKGMHSLKHSVEVQVIN